MRPFVKILWPLAIVIIVVVTTRYDTECLHALRSRRHGQTNLVHGTETKNKEKMVRAIVREGSLEGIRETMGVAFVVLFSLFCKLSDGVETVWLTPSRRNIVFSPWSQCNSMKAATAWGLKSFILVPGKDSVTYHPKYLLKLLEPFIPDWRHTYFSSLRHRHMLSCYWFTFLWN